MAISVVVLGIVASIGSVVLIGVRDTNSNTTGVPYTLAGQAATGIGEYGNWFKIIVIVGVAAVILGLIFVAFRPQETAGNY